MKIKVTEIEATAQELRACNTVADGMVNILRDIFSCDRCEDEDPPECEDEDPPEEV